MGVGRDLELDLRIGLAERELVDVAKGRRSERDLPWYAPTVQHVDSDSCGNVYFITTHSSPFSATHGFVWQNGSWELCGDEVARRMELQPLFGSWYRFVAD